ncbi:hypothetical protein ACFQPA_01725 [Halomarina halobia]|uniref:Uncharacterized protein n=1 Tax=Halomarina halobia TaxID=3033386 RepID=A0ABD6A6H1_9EURY|nr:hypothetical protein [Halomarina sp. PSR21]
MLAPRGIFGIPHGILSSPDERIAFAIGLVALVAAVLHDGDRDLRPVSGAAVVGILVALGGSFVAPPLVTDEWHVPVFVVLLVIAGAVVARRRG